MNKFLVLYKASTEDFQKAMASATPEQQKAGMDAWMAWSKKAGSALVDMGAPLGKTVRVGRGGSTSAVTNDLGGYSIMQGESKEAVAASLREHPHFMMMGDSASIEVIDIVKIPGM